MCRIVELIGNKSIEKVEKMDFLAKGIFWEKWIPWKSDYALSDSDSMLKSIFTKHFRNLNVLEMESLELQKMVSQSTTQLAVIVAILHWK